jgi:hypothetical protein
MNGDPVAAAIAYAFRALRGLRSGGGISRPLLGIFAAAMALLTFRAWRVGSPGAQPQCRQRLRLRHQPRLHSWRSPAACRMPITRG